MVMKHQYEFQPNWSFFKVAAREIHVAYVTRRPGFDSRSGKFILLPGIQVFPDKQLEYLLIKHQSTTYNNHMIISGNFKDLLLFV